MHLFKHAFTALLLTTAGYIACTATLAAETTSAPAWQRVHLAGYDFPVYANHDLVADGSKDGNKDSSKIREVIFIQHGIQRNGDEYYTAAMNLLKASGRSGQDVLIIAPNFPGTPDADKGFIGMPVWTVQGWTGGDVAQAAAGVPADLSSLRVLDDLALMVADKKRFPLVSKINFVGHSGGAQLIHRYAVLNHVDDRLRSQGLDVQYVVANPSSYLYFTSDRPSAKGFAPYDTTVCANYDDYRYGMQHMVAYANKMSGDELYRRYQKRQVTYLAGTSDNDPNHRVLDKSCGAEAEGPNRLERARGYWHYEALLDTQLAAQVAGKVQARAESKTTAAANANPALALPVGIPPLMSMHQYLEVNGVGHDQERMFGSQCGMQAVFGVAVSDVGKGATCKVVNP
ncbi:hypothetical protein ACO0LM_20345 [Undibacterium sp. Di26W]|uniref:hypothetical protein n=1 Tax=Undibacterium sp. Di26W TaxID=3413035 RepID=UPI003BF44F86